MQTKLAIAALAVALTIATNASADPAVGEAAMTVAVGATKSLDVGYARGLRCDDAVTVHAELRADTPQSNRLFVTGLRPGVTQCRAGTLGNPTVLVTITITR